MPELPTGVREGEVLAGKYRIGEVLGAGAMGTVFAAHHLLLDQKVAIKVLIPQASRHPEALGRFMREARAAVRIKSEHVVRVLDVAIESGVPYIVMEYLEGCDLAEWLRRHGSLAVAQATDFVLQACDAIQEAHGLDIIHRDIKPPNLFAVQRANVAPTIKVLDFGISKTIGIVPATLGSGDWKPGSVVTEDRMMIGSPYYMSPEQMESARDVDARTDVWALGVTLYELVTGKLPFEGQSLLQVYSSIVSSPPLRLRDSSPHVPDGLEAVIFKCLERRREARYRTVGELASALVGFGSSRATTYVERIARTDSSETASPESPTNVTPRPGALLAQSVGATLPSRERVVSDAPAKKRNLPVQVAAVAASVLVLALSFRIASQPSNGKAAAGSGAAQRAETRSALSSEPDPGPRKANPVVPSGLGAIALPSDAGSSPIPSPSASSAAMQQAVRVEHTMGMPKSAGTQRVPVTDGASSRRAESRDTGSDAAKPSLQGAEWSPPEVQR